MPVANQTPAELGFRMPAEWERQEAVWLSWPHRRATWPGGFRPIPAKFAEIAAHISLREKVRLNIAARHHGRARSLIARAGPTWTAWSSLTTPQTTHGAGTTGPSS